MSAAFATAELAGTRKWRKPPFIESTLLRRGLLLLTIVYLIAAFGSLDVNWERVYLGLERGWKFIVAFSRPDFMSSGEVVYDGAPADMKPEDLTEIYGEEDWKATIRKVEDEAESETGEAA